MNTSEVLQLIQTLKETGFKHVDVSHEGSHILLSNSEHINMTGSSAAVQSQIAAAPVYHQMPQEVIAHSHTKAVVAPQPIDAKEVEESVQAEAHEAPSAETLAAEKENLGGHLVESPIVGTYYEAATPDADPFVSVGSKVKKGDTLCIIEAMKLMNEIEADADGEIAEILVKNEEGVEYGQPLFRIV